MKPQLDRMTDLIVAALLGEAREFYNREFAFFGEVTSISGKLKPFIERSKAEKKVTFYGKSRGADDSMKCFRLKLTKKWQRYKWTSEYIYLVIPMES